MHNIYHANSIQRKAGVAILLDKRNSRMKDIIKDKGHFIMVNRLIHEEDITILDTYACQNRASKFITQN